MNFRKGKRKYISIETINWTRLHDENIQRLSKNEINTLEKWFPLTKEEYLGSLRYDGKTIRMDLLKAVEDKKISLKIAQLELRRRRKLNAKSD